MTHVMLVTGRLTPTSMQWITLQSLDNLPKSLEHALGYIWDKLGAFTLISAKTCP